MVWASDGEETDAAFKTSTANTSLFGLRRFLPQISLRNLRKLDCYANRYPLRLKAPCHSRPGLPGAVDPIFEAGQLLGADGAAGVEFSGGNSDLGAEAELAAIGELRRCVVQYDGRVDLVEEFLRDFCVFGHDRVGVMRAVVMNVRDRVVDAVDNSGGDDRILIFGVPVLV